MRKGAVVQGTIHMGDECEGVWALQRVHPYMDRTALGCTYAHMIAPMPHMCLLDLP